MAGSVNKVILIGALGRDPEVRTTSSDQKIVNLSIATSERWKDKHTGERKEKTEWHRVVIFNEHLADIAERFLKKGSSVYLEGKLQTRKWTDQSGVEKYSTEVVLDKFAGGLALLGDPKGGEGERLSSDGGGSKPGSSYGEHRGGMAPRNQPSKAQVDYLDEDIPF